MRVNLSIIISPPPPPLFAAFGRAFSCLYMAFVFWSCHGVFFVVHVAQRFSHQPVPPMPHFSSRHAVCYLTTPSPLSSFGAFFVFFAVCRPFSLPVCLPVCLSAGPSLSSLQNILGVLLLLTSILYAFAQVWNETRAVFSAFPPRFFLLLTPVRKECFPFLRWVGLRNSLRPMLMPIFIVSLRSPVNWMTFIYFG